MEMYTEYLSPSFMGKTFTQAAIICYTKLKLLLLAIESSNENGIGSHLSINPGSSVKVEAGTRGFFIAGSVEEIKRAFFYCEICHKDVIDLAMIKKCKCNHAYQKLKKNVRAIMATNILTRPGETKYILENVEERKHMNGSNMFKNDFSFKNFKTITKLIKNYEEEEEEKKHYEEQFDSTGMFHYVKEQEFKNCLLNTSSRYTFAHHVIVCIFAEQDSPLIGLRNFVLPLRASNYHYDELKDIVFIGNSDFLAKEWKSISNFPKIHIFPGSPNSRSILRSCNIQFCDMCVIISGIDRDSNDEHLIDKSAILCALNIKAMSFDDTIGLMGETYNILPTGMAPLGNIGDLNPQKPKIGTHIPMLTELRVDSNVQFLDQDDEDDPGSELYVSQPFACGTAFAISVLDCIMSTAYFNDNALTLIRTLITGGTTPELEQILAEGGGIAPGGNSHENFENRNRPRISQISLFDGDFAKFGENRLYGELFVHCLSHYNMLCWGVYRLKDSHVHPHKTGPPGNNRYVICNPSADFRLMPTDLVYVLQQFDPNFSTSHLGSQAKSDERKDPKKNPSPNPSNFTFKRKFASQSNIRRNTKSSNTLNSSKAPSVSTIDDYDDLNDRYQTSFDKSLENIQMLNRMKTKEKNFQVRV